MTKKYYIMIAKMIKDNAFYMNNGGLVINGSILYSLLKEMKKDNPNFKEDVFLNACGLKWEYIEDITGRKIPFKLEIKGKEFRINN
tara:strand:- start:180 stop:437 length:258 start_codon:yes stop_codon:yes gene_type:complete